MATKLTPCHVNTLELGGLMLVMVLAFMAALIALFNDHLVVAAIALLFNAANAKRGRNIMRAHLQEHHNHDN